MRLLIILSKETGYEEEAIFDIVMVKTTLRRAVTTGSFFLLVLEPPKSKIHLPILIQNS